jgi:hypothetical protein
MSFAPTVDVGAMRIAMWSVAVAVAATAVGLSAGLVVQAAVHVQVPRPLFQRVVGDVRVFGRVTSDVPPSAAADCGVSESFTGLVSRSGGFQFPVGDWGRRAPRYGDASGVAIVDQPSFVDLPAPVAVYLVHVQAVAKEVRARFADGSTDAMRPVEGWAVLVDQLGHGGHGEQARFEIVGARGESLAAVDVPPTLGPGATARCMHEP